MNDMFGFWIFAAIMFVIIIVLPIRSAIKGRRDMLDAVKLRGKNEALFGSMFPELQPHFHPEQLVKFVTARLARGPAPAAYHWDDPPGFPAGTVADSAVGEMERERVRLSGPSGGALGEFQFEKNPEGGVLRLGKGKLTVDLRKSGDPRVRYWHPDREFKWSRAGWIFKTPVADEPFESSSGSSSTSTSDSSSGMSRAAAAGAGIVGLGGTYDGGGASAGWDESSARVSSSADEGDSSGASTAAASGDSSSDSASTSY